MSLRRLRSSFGATDLVAAFVVSNGRCLVNLCLSVKLSHTYAVHMALFRGGVDASRGSYRYITLIRHTYVVEFEKRLLTKLLSSNLISINLKQSKNNVYSGTSCILKICVIVGKHMLCEI